MLLKMLYKDLSKKRGITTALFIFMMLAALLVSSGSNMIAQLSNSLNHLFTAAKAPHYVQMHSGELDQSKIDEWTTRHPLVEHQQTVEMINIDGSNLYLGSRDESEQATVMDIDFVTQNRSFDLLLNLNSEPIHVSQGEIAVPIYFMQQRNLEVGDKVTIATSSFTKELTVVDFVRDAQMNPSIVHSKRFVVDYSDYELIKHNVGEKEYLIEFRLYDVSKIGEFHSQYQASDLPKTGPSIDHNLFKTLQAITDGAVAGVIIVVSVLLNLIAILCIRFTMLQAIEEDYKEIGVLKAIGIRLRDLKAIYMIKYIFLASVASLLGYMASLMIGRLFTANMRLYLGTAPKSLLQHLVPVIAVTGIFLMVVLFCLLVLRRFQRISVVEALRSGQVGETKLKRNKLSLSRSRLMKVPIFLGLKDVLQRFKVYRLLLFVFIVSAFMIIVPVNFLNTIQSPSFISYMGIGQSDIRIDLRQSDDVAQRYHKLMNYLHTDDDVEQYAPLVTSQFRVVNSDGTTDRISIETGDLSKFPLDYLEGNSPTNDHEIALSVVNGKEMGKQVGDTVVLMVDGEHREMKVSGIYQDITQGGRTAKALLPYNPNSVLWYVVNVDVKSHIVVSNKIQEYEATFAPAKVTDLNGYLHQTLGGTIEQLKLTTIAAIALALLISMLITSLFLRMLIAKDHVQIAIMKSIGFSLGHLRQKYVTITVAVLGAGIVLGTLISNTIGQTMVSLVMSFFGASSLKFVVDPVQAYIVFPLALMLMVTITTLLSIASMKKSSIVNMIAE